MKFKCETCGMEDEPQRKDKRYCSRPCSKKDKCRCGNLKSRGSRRCWRCFAKGGMFKNDTKS